MNIGEYINTQGCIEMTDNVISTEGNIHAEDMQTVGPTLRDWR